MSKRDEILNSISNPEYKVLSAKIIDYIEQVEKYYEPRFTVFLDPAQVNKARNIIEQFNNVKYSVTCGVPNCERNIIAIFPFYMEEEDIELPINALCITGSSKFEIIGHRDILGAVMNLGIKREKIGDIILNNQKHYIIVYSDISSYISLNLSKIKHTPVSVDYIDFKDIPLKQNKFKEISTSVVSLRLDAVISAGFGESRSSISKEIVCGNVRVNWEGIQDLSFTIREGDTISLKGKGRIILDKIGSLTKKGRINIIIKKII